MPGYPVPSQPDSPGEMERGPSPLVRGAVLVATFALSFVVIALLLKLPRQGLGEWLSAPMPRARSAISAFPWLHNWMIALSGAATATGLVAWWLRGVQTPVD